MCTIFLPGSIAPMPDNLYNPYAVEVPPDPDIPTFPAMPSVPPPSNPLQPYNPPLGVPECPFIKKCGRKPGEDKFEDCVGYDSWGFDEVRMGKYSPASRFFNSVNCFYIMKPYNRFHVPKKVEAFWYLAKKRGDVKDLYDSEELTLTCEDQSFTNPWADFCDDMVWRLKTSCGTKWNALWTGTCKKAPAPPHFTVDSYLGEFCPLDCGFLKYDLQWLDPIPPGPSPGPAPIAGPASAPAEPTKTVVRVTVENIDFALLRPNDQENLKAVIQSTLAKQAGVSFSAVSVRLFPGSVQVLAEIATPPGATAEGVKALLGKVDIGEQIVTITKQLPGVMNAAKGDLSYSNLLVETMSNAMPAPAPPLPVAAAPAPAPLPAISPAASPAAVAAASPATFLQMAV